MTKAEKAAIVNEAIKRSNLAVSKGAAAELLEDGTIMYSTRYPRHPESKRRETLRGILTLLHGQDARAILAAIK